MSKDTGIRIETVKEVNDRGEKGYRITKIEALASNNLPALYLGSDKPAVYQESGILHIRNQGKNVSFEGGYLVGCRFYQEETVEIIMALIREAGQHLADVNARLRKERKSWNGKVTFVDGKEVHNKKTKEPPRPW